VRSIGKMLTFLAVAGPEQEEVLFGCIGLRPVSCGGYPPSDKAFGWERNHTIDVQNKFSPAVASDPRFLLEKVCPPALHLGSRRDCLPEQPKLDSCRRNPSFTRFGLDGAVRERTPSPWHWSDRFQARRSWRGGAHRPGPRRTEPPQDTVCLSMTHDHGAGNRAPHREK
jgi:hypothetical protein